MLRLEFIVPGRPRPKQRPRFGQGHVYTPKETRLYEEEVWWMAYDAGARQDCFRGKKLKIHIRAVMGREEKDLLYGGDSDNVQKCVMDGLAPAFNDAYVVDVHVVKVLGEPKCVVTIEVI